jgi:hypothetical protein
MINNPALSIIFLLLVALNLISLYYLKKLEIKDYFIDTALVSGTMLFLSAAYFFGQPAFLLGVLIYGFRMTNADNILKFIFLYAGFGIGYFTSNNFYTYTSVGLLTLFTIIRLVESIIEMTLWSPDTENHIEKD